MGALYVLLDKRTVQRWTEVFRPKRYVVQKGYY